MKKLAIILCSFLLINNSSLGQTYELQKICNILPSISNLNFLELQSSTSGYSLKSVWAGTGNKTENEIYEFNGTEWSLHSTYSNRYLTFKYVFKLNNNEVWALASTEPVSMPPGSFDTSYLMKYENNQWNKNRILGTYPYGTANGQNYNSIIYNSNINNGFKYFSFKDSLYYINNNNKLKAIYIGKIQNDTTYSDIHIESENNIHLVRRSGTYTENQTKIYHYFHYNGINWTLLDSLVAPAIQNIVHTPLYFIPNNINNSKPYLYKITVDVTSGYSTIEDLYTIENNKLKFVANLSGNNIKMILPKISADGIIYFLSLDYASSNDTVELYKVQNNSAVKLLTYTGQMGKFNRIYTINNEVWIAIINSQAPFNNELYKVIERKPIRADFSYTIQNMTVQFTKLDTACKNFIWDFGNGNTSTINPNPLVTYASPGSYSVCLKCGTSDPVCTIITVPCNNCAGQTGILNTKNETIKIHPNPAQNRIFIEDEEIKKYSIFNLIGQEVMSGNEIPRDGVDISSLNSSIYTIKVVTGNKQTKIGRFVKE